VRTKFHVLRTEKTDGSDICFLLTPIARGKKEGGGGSVGFEEVGNVKAMPPKNRRRGRDEKPKLLLSIP